jgi:hypothetical protein
MSKVLEKWLKENSPFTFGNPLRFAKGSVNEGYRWRKP